MRTTGIVIDPRYQNHLTGRGHPERPERIGAVQDWLAAEPAGWARVAPRAATGEELALVHDGAYVAEVAATQGRESFRFDADTPASAASYETACLAAGGVLQLVDAVMAGTIDNGFAFVRPPGHHAEARRAMGFCLFNNVAVAAAYLRRQHGIRRVLVVDWDVHHGNGTQHMFERDPDVLFVSSHQYPFYPGTGAHDESGIADGEGRTVNLPLPAGCGDAEYADVFERVVVPIAHLFEPEFVLISAGFDAHARDPLGAMEVTEAGFRGLARQILAVAAAHSGGRCVAVLEGGYDLSAIRDSAAAVTAELAGDTAAIPAAGASRIDSLRDRLLVQQRRYWRI